jgi:hypothetical protein
MIDVDPREEYQQEHLQPTEDLKEIHIGSQPHQTTKIGTSLDPIEEEVVINLLRKNLDLFAWQPSDKPGIDPSVLFHHLTVNPEINPVDQIKRKIGQIRRKAMDEEVKKLKDARFISKIKYPTWLSNTVSREDFNHRPE